IVNAVPIETSRDVFRLVISFLQRVRLAKLGNRLVVTPYDPQIVPVHVLGMWYRRTERSINCAVPHRFFWVPDAFVGMHQIMFGCWIVRRDCEGGLIVGNGTNESSLSSSCRCRLLRISPQYPQFGIARILRQRLVNALLICF